MQRSFVNQKFETGIIPPGQSGNGRTVSLDRRINPCISNACKDKEDAAAGDLNMKRRIFNMKQRIPPVPGLRSCFVPKQPSVSADVTASLVNSCGN
jgi:hypothetical protein